MDFNLPKLFSSYIDELKTRTSLPHHFIQYFLMKYFGFPDLFFRWPIFVYGTLALLLRKYPFSVYTFSAFDLRLRSYYSKIARNFHELGRNGYAWDESLGFSMRPRFGSNLITYYVYRLAPARVFSLLCLFDFFCHDFYPSKTSHYRILRIKS